MAPRANVHSARPTVIRRSAGSRGAAATTAGMAVRAVLVPRRRTTCRKWRVGEAAKAASSCASQPAHMMGSKAQASMMRRTWRLVRPVKSGHESTTIT